MPASLTWGEQEDPELPALGPVRNPALKQGQEGQRRTLTVKLWPSHAQIPKHYVQGEKDETHSYKLESVWL